jgi:hypothetical protein
MGYVVLAVVVVAVIIAAAYFVTKARQTATGAGSGAMRVEGDIGRPSPAVAEFHVKGTEAQVFFDVPLPEEEDEVLASLLVHEAIEVVREKRHTLPIEQAHRVVAFGKSGDGYRQAGSVDLETPGTLPPPTPPPSLIRSVGPDPLAAFGGDGGTGSTPQSVGSVPPSELGPAGSEVKLSSAVAAAIRLQGLEPDSASAGELVLAVLRLSGYSVPEPSSGSAIATHPVGRTFIQLDELQPGGYPELAESVVNRFMIDFGASGCDRGLLVSDRFGPFLVYDKERREPRVKFVTRERLQHFVDSLTLG